MSTDKKLDDVSKRLDIIVALLLASRGLTKAEIAKIMGVSEKTIQRMFSGYFEKIQADNIDR